jgi:hypothetical protein
LAGNLIEIKVGVVLRKNAERGRIFEAEQRSSNYRFQRWRLLPLQRR